MLPIAASKIITVASVNFNMKGYLDWALGEWATYSLPLYTCESTSLLK